MNISKLQYITNANSPEGILSEVEAVVSAGCDWVQLRIKDESINFENVARAVQTICEGRAVFIVNDKVDIAKRINADGVHLGLEDMTIPEAREILGANKIIGGTANTLDDCLMHQNNGADYIGLGPFRKTNTKKKLSPVLGIEGYQNIVPKVNNLVNIPVVAIGGIIGEDIKELIKTTAVHGVAVSGLISNAVDKSNLISEINKIVEDNSSANTIAITKEFSKQ